MIKAAVKKVMPKWMKESVKKARQQAKFKKYLMENADNLKYLNYAVDNREYIEALCRGDAIISFSQSGEDLSIRYALYRMQKSEITYMDVGCNDQYKLNNTAMLRKWFKIKKGVAVEPNPDMCGRIRSARPDAVCLNIGLCAVDRTGAGGQSLSLCIRRRTAIPALWIDLRRRGA